jgi:hypothetical protein
MKSFFSSLTRKLHKKRQQQVAGRPRKFRVKPVPPGVEPLEERVLLDTKPFPAPLLPASPPGSLAFSRTAADSFGSPGETDSFTIRVTGNQTLAAVLQPLDGSVKAALRRSTRS